MDKLWKYAKILFTVWIILVTIVFVAVGYISIYNADQENPGGYCDSGYKYDRWSYPAKLMRDENCKPIPC